jgi:hypothetical protein
LGSVFPALVERPSDTPIADAGYSTDYGAQQWTNLENVDGDGDGVIREIRISDISALTVTQMREMLRNMRIRARSSGWPVVPVIVENHTKDIGNWRPIERFAAIVAASQDIQVITLRELAENILAGRYPVDIARAGRHEAA